MQVSAINVLACIIIMVILLSVSFIFIPYYLRMLRSNSTENGTNVPQSNQHCSVNRSFFAAFAFGITISMIVILKNNSSDNSRVPVQAFVVTFTLNFILFLLIIMDKEANAFTKRSVKAIIQQRWQTLQRLFTRNVINPVDNCTTAESCVHDQSVTSP
jgi:hypothetical protein